MKVYIVYQILSKCGGRRSVNTQSVRRSFDDTIGFVSIFSREKTLLYHQTKVWIGSIIDS